MVNKAPIKVKEAQFNSNSTLHCGFNMKIELNGLKEILGKGGYSQCFSQYLFQYFPLSMNHMVFHWANKKNH
jgi:hypothetical protein